MSLLIADAMGLVCRAHHGARARPLRDERGKDISARVITEKWLARLMAMYPAFHYALAWDMPGTKTFRHEACATYKAGRAKHPSGLLAQLDAIVSAAAEMGWDSWRAQGFEADDVIATLAAPTEVRPVVVVSPDKDILQLVQPGVTVLRPQGPVAEWEAWGELEVLMHMGVEPGQVATLLALAGDKADGIEGAAGVGSKKALKMIEAGPVPMTEALAATLELTRLRSDAPLERFAQAKGGSR